MNSLEYTYFRIEKENRISYRVFYSFLYVMFIIYAFILLTALAFDYNYSYVTIQGTSMQPTLNKNPVLSGDGSSFQDAVYLKHTKDVDYGDIIVIQVPQENDESYSIIKRVIAKENDYITIVKLPIVMENGVTEWQYRVVRKIFGSSEVEVLQEDYIKSYEEWSLWDGNGYLDTGMIVNNEVKYTNLMEYEPSFFANYIENNECTKLKFAYSGNTYQAYFFKVGQDKFSKECNQIFFMGDNRTGSTDARMTGTRGEDMIIGKVVKIIHDAVNDRNLILNINVSFNKVFSFFEIIWNEILSYFSFPS